MTSSIHKISRDTQAKEAIRSFLREHFANIQRAVTLSAEADGRRELRNSARNLIYALEYFRPFVNYEHLVEVRESLDVIVQTLGEISDEETLIKSLIKTEPEAPLKVLDGIRRLVEERRSLLDSLIEGLAAPCESSFRLSGTTFSNRLHDALIFTLPRSVTLNELAHTIISSCLDEMETASTALYRPSKTRTSHRLRISVRKLRYALDLFAPYFTADLRALSAELIPLHAQLGKLRDCDVKLNVLGNWLSEHQPNIHSRSDMTSEWQAAIWLLAYIFERRPKRYGRALAAGQELLASAFASRVESALMPPSTAQEVPTQFAGSTPHQTLEDLRT